MAIKDWLDESREEYDPDKIHEGLGVVTQTRFGSMMKILEENNLETLLPAEKVAILIVGPGGNSELGYMPYELYELTAYLEAHGIDYDLTILEILPQVAEQIRKRSQLEVSIWDLLQSRTADMFDEFSWPTYCRYVDHKSEIQPNQEICCAPIPKSLVKKLDDEEVDIIIGDVALTQLPKNKYDLVICRNVLYQISEAGRKLAFYNLSSSMRTKGNIWTNYDSMIISPRSISSDSQDRTSQQNWFRDLGLKKGHVLMEVNGYPLEFLFYKPN